MIFNQCQIGQNLRLTSYLCRNADDFVCAFEKSEDAERFYKELGQRLSR